MNYIFLIFLSLAAIADATMDTLKDHFSVSIFKNLNPDFWNPAVSSGNTKFLGIVVLDAWHIIKYAFLGFVFLFAMTYHAIFGYWDFIIMFFYWSAFFELFYSVIYKN